jgi:peroxiredoxin
MQLVELSETVGADQEMAVVAISYDPIHILAGFAQDHSITFPLLSDEGSVAIADLGLLNESAADDAVYWGRPPVDRYRGLPYPGTFVLDGDGVVIAKEFERSHRNRTSAALLMAPLDRRPPAPDEMVAEGRAPGVSVRASSSSGAVFPNQIFSIDVVVSVAPGMHVYVPPVPDGFRALTVELDAPVGVYWSPPALPAGATWVLPGLDERFTVAEGDVTLSIPVHIHEALSQADVVVRVGYQACDDVSCLPPETLMVPLSFTVRPKL